MPRRAAILAAALVSACVTSPPPRPTPPAVRAVDKPRLLVKLGDDLRRAGDPAGAADLYRAAADNPPRRDPAALIRLGEALNEAGDPLRAEAAFRAALTAEPGRAETRHGLAVALLAQGRAHESLELLDGLPESPRVFRARGVALDLLGYRDRAEAAFRQGLTLAPADAGLHGNLALSLALDGNSAPALAELRAALAAPDPDPRQDGNAVLVLALLGRTEEARARGAATVGPAVTAALIARAEAARAAPKWSAAAQALGVVTGARSTPAPGDLPPPITGAGPAPAVEKTAAPPGARPRAGSLRPESGVPEPPPEH